MIHHVDEGPRQAKAVLLAHSLGTDHRLWDAQAALLRERFRVVRYDARGHGRSPPRPGPGTLADLAGDALELADRLGIERFHVCGLSIGGQVAQWLAIHAPARVDRLVIANSGAKIGSAEIWDARIAAVRAGGVAAVADGVVERWLTARFRAAAPEVAARARGWLLAVSPQGYIAGSEAVRDADLRDAVAGITAPTLIICGTHDVATPPADARFLAQHIRGARLVELDSAHIGNLEAEREFNEALFTFLNAEEPWTSASGTTRG